MAAIQTSNPIVSFETVALLLAAKVSLAFFPE